jgi:hypothetical protein
MITPIKTIWKYGIVFATTKEEIEKYARETDAKTIWCGEVLMTPLSIAETVAEIHPNFEKYYDKAMMILYKTYNTIKGGTEDARIALISLKTEKEIHGKEQLPYIFIWKIVD